MAIARPDTPSSDGSFELIPTYEDGQVTIEYVPDKEYFRETIVIVVSHSLVRWIFIIQFDKYRPNGPYSQYPEMYDRNRVTVRNILQHGHIVHLSLVRTHISIWINIRQTKFDCR
jgi:hypothetical protein